MKLIISVNNTLITPSQVYHTCRAATVIVCHYQGYYSRHATTPYYYYHTYAWLIYHFQRPATHARRHLPLPRRLLSSPASPAIIIHNFAGWLVTHATRHHAMWENITSFSAYVTLLCHHTATSYGYYMLPLPVCCHWLLASASVNRCRRAAATLPYIYAPRHYHGAKAAPTCHCCYYCQRALLFGFIL